MPEGSELAARGSVRLAELKDETFFFPWSSHRSCALYHKLCKGAGFTPKIVSNSNFLMRIKLVAATSFLENIIMYV